MSTGTSVDVSHIQDEELLRKMWQDTEDFGKKKEIRSHMYKLREERLRNFYSSGDTTSEKVSNIVHESNAKELCGSTHADALKDYSFLSLKSKEIRDSESPTKDIQYIIPDKSDGNQGWNITSTNEKIPGGYSTSQVAVTSGSEKIDGGVANYSAECAQNASITSEGDDKNYVKSFKTNSKNAVQQVAKREDDSGNFQSFSNFSNSSSKVVTHHQSSSQDLVDNSSFPANFDNSVSKGVEYKTYITDVPAELKANPNYVDGKTKVTTETRTLEDGSTVTTTRYETKYAVADTSSQNYSTTSNQKFVSKEKTDYDSKLNKTNTSDTSKIIVQRIPNLDQKTNITNVSSTNKAVQKKEDLTDSQTYTTKSTQIVIDRNEQNNFDEKRENVTETFKNDLLQKNLRNNENVTKTTITEKIVKSDDQGFAKKIENERVTSTKSDEIPRYIEIIPSKPETRETQTKIDRTDKNITIKKHYIPEQVDQEFVIHITPTPSKPSQEKPDKVTTTIIRTVDDYSNKADTKVHQVIEQINKRISVEVSPTHQAFARSLRAVSPDHDKKRGSTRSLKSSVTSLRSSKSPEKTPNNRSTPERKYTTPSRESSPTKNIKNNNISPITNGAPKQVPKNPSRNRSTSPKSDAETYRKIQRITVDVEETSVNKTTGNKSIPNVTRPSKNVVDRSPTSPTKSFTRESPTKEKPQERQDRPFKRRDTYEERCKQILGIPEKESPKPDTNKSIRNVTRITKELSRDKLIKSSSRSPEKTCKPIDDNLKSSPKRKTPNQEDYPSQKRQVPNTETHVKRNPSKDNLNAPKKGVDEPEIGKKYVKPLCDGDDFPHLQKHPATCSPSRKPKDLIDLDTEKPHKIVKKDNPYKEYPSTDDENVYVTRHPSKEPSNFPDKLNQKTETKFVTKITSEQTNTFTRPSKPGKKSPDDEDLKTTGKKYTRKVSDEFYNTTDENEKDSPRREPTNKKPTSPNKKVDETERITKTSITEQKNTFTRPKPDKKSPDDEDVCRPKPSDTPKRTDDFYHKNIKTTTTEFETTDRKSPGREPKRPTSPNKRVDETQRFTKTSTTEQRNTFTRPNKHPDDVEKVDAEKDTHDFYHRNIRTDVNETITTDLDILDRKSIEREPTNKNKRPTSPNKREDETEHITKTVITEQRNTFTRPNKPDKRYPDDEDVCKPKPEKDTHDFYHTNIRTDGNETVTTEFQIIDRKSPGREPINKNKRPTSPNKKVDETEHFTKTSTTEQRNTFTRPSKSDKKYPEDEDVCRPKPDHTNVRTDENKIITMEFEIRDSKSPGREPINKNKRPTSPSKKVDETGVTKTSIIEQRNTFTRPNKPDKKSPHNEDARKPKPERDTEDITARKPVDKNRVIPSSKKLETEWLSKTVITEQSNTFTRPKKTNKKSPSTEDLKKVTRKVSDDFYHKNININESESITTEFQFTDRKSPDRKPVNKDRDSPSKKLTSTNKKVDRKTSETVTVDSSTFKRPNKLDKKSPSPFGDVCKPIDKKPKHARGPTDDDTEDDHGFTETTDIVYSTRTTKDQMHSQRSPTRKGVKPNQQDSDDEESSTDDDAPTVKENIRVDYDEVTEVRTSKTDSFGNIVHKTQLKKKPTNGKPGKLDKPKRNESSLFENEKVVTEVTEYTDSYCTRKPDKQRERVPKSNVIEYQPNKKPVNDKTYKKPLPERQSPLKQVTDFKTVKNVKQTTKTQIDRKSDLVDKRHVVTATISISPKPKPLQEKKTDKKPSTYKTISKTEPIIPTKFTEVNNKTTTKTITHVVPQTDKKITRTVSHKTIKTSHPTPVRGQSKPELLEKHHKHIETEKNKKNVITTKSITLDNSYEDENEVIINLQRSISSRESTPNRICPRLIPNTEDTSIERFPDEIIEPAETSKKPTRLSDISIIGSVDLIQHERRTDKVTLQELGKKPRETDEVDRRYPKEPQLNVPPQSYRPKSPKCENYSDDSVDESFTSVSDKISRFIETAENVQNYTNKSVVERPNIKQISDDIKSDDCLLSVSQKVNKFTAAQNVVNVPNRSKPNLENQSPKRKTPLENVPREKSPSKNVLVRERSDNESFRLYRSDTNETRNKTEFQIRESPRRESPAREYPRRESPGRESPMRESPRRDPLTQVLPTRDSPKRESPTREPLSQVFPKRESPTRESPLRDCPKQEFSRSKSPNQNVLYREPQGKLKPSLKDIYQQETQTSKFSSVKTSKFLIEDTQNKRPRGEQSPNREIIFTKTTTKTPLPVKETPRGVHPQSITKGRKSESTITTECVQIEDENQTYTRRTSPPKQTPDQKSPTKTVSKKEIYETKTSKPADATPKSTRTLSSVGRLRSTESMKRAKELFENFSKTQTTETTIQKTKKPISPKDDYDLKSTHLIMNKVKSTGQVPKKENTPHYMLPLDRRPDEDDLVSDKTPRQRSRSPKMGHPYGSSSEDIPHYMLPLDRAPEEHHNEKIVYDKTPRHHSRSPSHSPHYMLPLDRTPDEHDRQRSCSPTTRQYPIKYSGDVPHYMLPLDRNPEEYVKSPRQRSRSPTTGQPYPKYSGNVPHYMIPLDRTPDEHDDNNKPKQRSRSPSLRQHYNKYSDNVPHYMLPLDRAPDNFDNDSLDKSPRQRSRSPSSGQPYSKYTGSVPHYMLPLDRTPDEHDVETLHRSRSPTTKHSSQTPENVPHYMLPLDRTPDEHDNDKTGRLRSQSPPYIEKSSKTVNGQVPHYMLPISKSPHENHHEKPRSRETTPKLSRGSTPDKCVPSYMKPLEKNVKSKKAITKSSILETEIVERNDVESVKTTKFGVTLRRTSSGRKVISSNDTEISNENEIEKIFDINILEFLLEQATTYDQRRRLRAQIRVAKQTFGSKVSVKDQKTSRKVVTTSVDTSSKKSQITKENSSKNLVVDRRTERVEKNKPRQKSPEKGYENQKVSTTKKIVMTRNEVVENSQDKPSWITQKPLKKASDRVVKKSSSTTSSSTRTKSETVKVSSYESEPIDLITSSYGVGPTDENGRPLFGLKALRAQNQTDTTKVKGTVIRSHFHSENGQEPVGEVSVTKFSNQPADFGENLDENGLVSVTTTQKFGSKGTPSYKTLIDTKYNPDSSCTSDSEVVNKSVTTKESRRGSVKELSKKYGETTVETVKSEKSGVYPKAGLILRSTYKDSTYDDGDRLESQENYETVEHETIKTSSTDTFLTNKSRVSGVQDVITRMKNSDLEYETGESPEDKEAKSLLNKFIGSQVILSGLETVCSSSSPTVRTVKRTTTTTTTTSKEGEKPTTVTRTFVHPITEEELATVWDEDTLKLLLERSTEYEERRIIRSRLRDVMAEQKVCDEIISKSKEGISEKVEETSQGTVIQGSVTTTQGATTQKTLVKPVSPFAKFRQLDKQNSINSPPGTPRTPTGSGPLFKFTDPELSRQASTVKERLLQWCQMKTKEYENVQLDNFSGSWADGLAFCALIHHFLPDAFDYHKLTPKERRHNFTLAFRVADEKADIMPLLDVDDMVATRKPDWKCVFTYVQTIYARFKNED